MMGQLHEFAPVTVLHLSEEMEVIRTAKHLTLRFVLQCLLPESAVVKLPIKVEASLCDIFGSGTLAWHTVALKLWWQQ